MLEQLYQSLWLNNDMSAEEVANRTQATIDLLRDIAPQSALEGMIAVQLVATHHAAMPCLDHGARGDRSAHGRDMHLRHATKFLALSLRQVEALGRYRTCSLTANGDDAQDSASSPVVNGEQISDIRRLR